jgi:hypothetical protein
MNIQFLKSRPGNFRGLLGGIFEVKNIHIQLFLTGRKQLNLPFVRLSVKIKTAPDCFLARIPALDMPTCWF